MSEQEIGTVPSSPVDLPSDVPVEKPEAKGEPEVEAEEPVVEEEAPPRPRSGFQRQKLKIAALEREIEALRTRDRPQPPAEELKRPKPEDFVDYAKYEDAKDAYDEQRMRKVSRDIAQESEQRQATVRAQEARAEAVKEFVTECEDMTSEFPDAQQAAANLLNEMGGPWKPEILDIIASARNAAVIHYWLTKNPGAAKHLNGLDRVSAAMMVGELQARAELPQGKRATTAPPPIHPPKGGAAAPKDAFNLAKKDDATDYIRMRMAEMKKES